MTLSNKKEKKKYIMDSSLGWTMGVGMFVFAYLGYLADEKLGKRPWGILLGIAAGLLYCGFEAWKSLRRIDQNNKKQ